MYCVSGSKKRYYVYLLAGCHACGFHHYFLIEDVVFVIFCVKYLLPFCWVSNHYFYASHVYNNRAI
jgi:hypothetical protein